MAAGEAARAHGLWLTGHAHAAAAVKLGVKAGFRVLYHCTDADDEPLELLDGDPSENVAILRNKRALRVIMKDGALYKHDH